MTPMLLASRRCAISIALPTQTKSALAWRFARIRGAVQVIGRVHGALRRLSGPVEGFPAGVQSNQVLVEIVLVVDVRRKAKPVTKRAVDGAARPPVRRLQV